ncbi:hypothetical protein COLO4_30429 [Corchorus olitorius]|uniref:Uncharacterized protein n=1 Tax=Corchorus olitorius TaxID=93759 RepID=A0A1R3H8I7_9ROSI|nr:hypothetical protein COLO4_30429 [Corchorus olitorius]
MRMCGHSHKYKCCAAFERLEKGADTWEPLVAPECFSHDDANFSGSYIFDDGKKILIVVNRSYSNETVHVYNSESNCWSRGREMCSPDYYSPVTDLGLLQGNNTSCVINGIAWSVTKALLDPIGLGNVLTVLQDAIWVKGEVPFRKFPRDLRLISQKHQVPAPPNRPSSNADTSSGSSTCAPRPMLIRMVSSLCQSAG